MSLDTMVWQGKQLALCLCVVVLTLAVDVSHEKNTSASASMSTAPMANAVTPDPCPRGCTCLPAGNNFSFRQRMDAEGETEDGGKNDSGGGVVVNCASRNLASVPLASGSKSNGTNMTTESATSSVIQLLLSHNQITKVDLSFLRRYPDLRVLSLRSNTVRSLSKDPRDYRPFFSLLELDLSCNSLHVIHPYVFTGFPSLRLLNLSSNVLHTLSPAAFALPALQTFDLSNNIMEEVHDHFFDTSPRLTEIDLSHNRVSRLNDGTFGLLTHLSLLDMSHNSLIGLEDNVLVGMNITHLDLGYNALRRSPDLALRKLTAVKTLVMDGNLFGSLDAGALRDIRVEFLSLSHCPHLYRLNRGAISSMPDLETLTLNFNPDLTYVHPGAISDAPKLAALDLSHNGLYALESGLTGQRLPRLRALYLAGNRFNCHCGLAWLGKIMQERDGGASLQVADQDSVRCRSHGGPGGSDDVDFLPVEQLGGQFAKGGGQCEPYILPLFPKIGQETMGKNMSWLCKALGSDDLDVIWRLPQRGSIVGDGECLERACVDGEGVLTIKYLHPSDEGKYTCQARNKFGQDQRQVALKVKSENIQIFPITVASTFVTLSWNTSSHLSTGRGYILQVKSADVADVVDAADQEILKQYEDIGAGLKMNSYTVNGLSPGHTYLFELCLRKEQYVITISSAELTTRAGDFEVKLGIETDYVSLFVVTLLLSGLVCACVTVVGFRVYRYQTLVGAAGRGGRGRKDTDALSQREMIMSPSDHSSVANNSCQNGVGVNGSNSCSNSCKNSTSSYSYTVAVAAGDQSRLVDYEVASPVDEVVRETVA